MLFITFIFLIYGINFCVFQTLDKSLDASETVPNQSKQKQQWIVMKDPPEIIKDGISELSKDNPLAYEHMEKMSSVLPTMWMGAQNGR